MSQELPVHIAQATPSPTKDQVYPEPVITVTPEKPHAYDDDISVPMKPQAYDESIEPGPPSYPVMKPNAPDPGYSLKDKPLPGSQSPVEQRGLIQAKNSTRSAPMQYTPEVGSNISQVMEEEESKGAFFESMQRKLSNKFTRDPLNNPPEFFDRQAQFSTPPQPFATFYIRSLGKHLEDGFPKAFPSAQLGSHDIRAKEWKQFLDDLAFMGKLSGGQKVVSSVFPVTRYVGFIGHTLTTVIENGLMKGTLGKVASLVDIWNAVFFHQRGVNVVLIQGTSRISGPPMEDDPTFFTTPSLPLYGSTPQMMSEYPPYSPVPQYHHPQASQNDLDRGNSLSSSHSSQSSQSTGLSSGSQHKSPVYNESYGHISSPEGSFGQRDQQPSEPSPTFAQPLQLTAQSAAPYGQSQPAPYGQSQPPAPYGQSQPAQQPAPHGIASPILSHMQNISSPFGYNQSLQPRHSHHHHKWERREEKKDKKKKKDNYYVMVEYQPIMSPTAMPPMM
ncbi:hypothetical protein K450DRAFT_226420 [Umbelopsis ramanniana AG]|uniref:Uncharacterized protein n=1 Tax=Umbelopsis ramanniana AG TaxID=1314678 RepID=A0AAD5EG16_UMBRA|nr:uncharacterized protein K450DRAFT_226420 [Umbelopsis ramanniana AG]KAI8582687.1 hypothetical protein K450DRAFT_226420 [Umbelopsis ramanniana AG]